MNWVRTEERFDIRLREVAFRPTYSKQYTVWNVSGVDVALDADGLQVRTEPISSVLFGGLAFETPVNAEPLKGDLIGLFTSTIPKRPSSRRRLRNEFGLYCSSTVR